MVVCIWRRLQIIALRIPPLILAFDFVCVCAHCFNCLDSQNFPLRMVLRTAIQITEQPFGQKVCCLASVFLGGMLRALQKCSCPKSFLRRRCWCCHSHTVVWKCIYRAHHLDRPRFTSLGENAAPERETRSSVKIQRTGQINKRMKNKVFSKADEVTCRGMLQCQEWCRSRWYQLWSSWLTETAQNKTPTFVSRTKNISPEMWKKNCLRIQQHNNKQSHLVDSLS